MFVFYSYCALRCELILLSFLILSVAQSVQSSLTRITDSVAQTLAEFELADDTEVLSLTPNLKHLDHLYFAEKKILVKKLQTLLGDMTDKAGWSHIEAECVARLKDECEAMGAQVEGMALRCVPCTCSMCYDTSACSKCR